MDHFLSGAPKLPRNMDVHWNQGLASYWRQLGDRIGLPMKPRSPPVGAGNVQTRAVRIRPDIVMSITPLDVNIVLQRLEPLPPDEHFDLIIATNVLIYYDVFEQSLALTNVAHMLRPGGWFLTNDSVSTVPVTLMRAVGAIDLAYSDQVNSRERLTWYQLR